VPEIRSPGPEPAGRDQTGSAAENASGNAAPSDKNLALRQEPTEARLLALASRLAGQPVLATRLTAIATLAESAALSPGSAAPEQDPASAEAAAGAQTQLRMALQHVEALAWRRRWPPAGSRLSRMMWELSVAESTLLGLLPLPELRRHYPALLERARQWLEPSDRRRRAFEDVASRRASYRDPAAERQVVRTATLGASEAEAGWLYRLRSFRNVLAIASGVVLLLVVAVAVAGAAGVQTLRLCFEAGALVCPTGLRTTPMDTAVVALVGAAGGLLTAGWSLGSMRASSAPVWLAGLLLALKVVTGALTSIVGLLLLRGEFIPGFGTLRSSGQVLAWAAVFGASQQVFTRYVDRQATQVLSHPRVRGGTDLGQGGVSDLESHLASELSDTVSTSLRQSLRETLRGPELVAFEGAVAVVVRPAPQGQVTKDEEAEPNVQRYAVRVTIIAGPDRPPGSLSLSVPGVGEGVPVFRVVPDSDTMTFSPAQQEVTMTGQPASSVEFTAAVPSRGEGGKAWVSVYQHTRLVQVCPLRLPADRARPGGAG
jgi:hypothetical protein